MKRGSAMKVEHMAPEEYNLTEELDVFARDVNRLAIRFLDDKGHRKDISYAELMNTVHQYANALTKCGLKRGDKVLVVVPRIPEAYYCYLACLKAGIVIIPCSNMLRANDFVYRIQHSEAKAIIAHVQATDEIDSMSVPLPSLQYKWVISGTKSGWESLEDVARNESVSFEGVKTRRDEMAFLPYTSGTTGNPKGVVHTHGWAYAHLQTAAKHWLGVREGDLVWATAAPGWQKWVWSPFLSTIGLGATAFVYNGPFDPNEYLALLEKEDINVLCCTPTEYRFMAKVDNLNRYRFPHLHSAVSAGEPLNRKVIEMFRDTFGINVRDGYGQTENTLLVGTMIGMEQRPGSMGKPTLEGQVVIVNEDGQPVAPHEVGEIAVHKEAAALFKEYYREPERTAQAFRGDYYITGDLARMDEDGFFWFEGRSDDIIISSGYTIGPFEVEDALTKHPAVKECAVVASPDEDRGAVVKAYIVLKDSTNLDEEALSKELQDHVKAHTAPYKYPRKVEFVESLPKTISGKIRRIELRQQEQLRAQ